MFFKGILPYLLIAGVFSSVVGVKKPGTVLSPSITNAVTDKLKSIINACSGKGFDFNVEDANTKITSCVQRFNELGEVQQEYPEVKQPRDWLDDDAVSAYKEALKTDTTLSVKYRCNQVKSTIECLEPLNSIVEQCQSTEGITLLSVAEEICNNDGKFIFDYSEAMECCGHSREFRTAFDACDEELEGIEEFRDLQYDPATRILNFCKLESFSNKCMRRGMAASPTSCAKASAVLQGFEEGSRSRTSNPEAVTNCFFNTN